MTINELQDALVLVGLIDPDAIEDPDGYDEGSTVAQIDELHAMLGWFRVRAHRETDEALLRQALTRMERHQPTVADTAPHVDVMAYNATITALRERLNETENPSFG